MRKQSYQREAKNDLIIKEYLKTTPYNYWPLNEGIGSTILKDYGTNPVDLDKGSDDTFFHNGIKYRNCERTTNTLTPLIGQRNWDVFRTAGWDTSSDNVTCLFWIRDTVANDFMAMVDMFRTRDASNRYRGTFGLSWKTNPNGGGIMQLRLAYCTSGNTDFYINSPNMPLSINNTQFYSSPVQVGFVFSATGAANGTIRWFLNGFNYATTSSITGPMSDLYWTSGFNYPFTVGNRAVGTYPSAAGKFVAIAHLGIWRRALDSSEILQLYNAGN